MCLQNERDLEKEFEVEQKCKLRHKLNEVGIESDKGKRISQRGERKSQGGENESQREEREERNVEKEQQKGEELIGPV